MEAYLCIRDWLTVHSAPIIFRSACTGGVVWFPDPSCVGGVLAPPTQEGSGNQTTGGVCMYCAKRNLRSPQNTLLSISKISWGCAPPLELSMVWAPLFVFALGPHNHLSGPAEDLESKTFMGGIRWSVLMYALTHAVLAPLPSNSVLEPLFVGGVMATIANCMAGLLST